MKVLHVTAPAPTGGLESVVEALASGQRERGYRTGVIAAIHDARSDDPFLDAVRTRGVDVHELRLPSRAYLRERREITRLCRELKPDVLHTHGNRSDVIGGSAGRVAGIPTVATVHGYIPSGWRGSLLESIHRQGLNRMSAVVAVSRPLASHLKRGGIPEELIHVVPNAWSGPAHPLGGIEARRELSVPPDAFHLGWVGRVSREKGLDVFLESLALLKDLPFIASIVGEGPLRARLRRRTRELSLEDRVRWHGLVPSAARLFPAFDALVLSSRTEGTPMVLLEAMALGVPLVATSVGGVPDVVSRKEALLVPPEDPEQLADAIRRVHHEPLRARRARTREAHRTVSARFDRSLWLDRYDAIYTTARSRSPGRRPRRQGDRIRRAGRQEGGEAGRSWPRPFRGASRW